MKIIEDIFIIMINIHNYRYTYFKGIDIVWSMIFNLSWIIFLWLFWFIYASWIIMCYLLGLFYATWSLFAFTSYPTLICSIIATYWTFFLNFPLLFFFFILLCFSNIFIATQCKQNDFITFYLKLTWIYKYLFFTLLLQINM